MQFFKERTKEGLISLGFYTFTEFKIPHRLFEKTMIVNQFNCTCRKSTIH